MSLSQSWIESAVFYEIYPQTFCDSNGDGIGDIPGIISKLDYVKSLGVSAVWLNPCFVSPFRDAGYDIADYRTVAPRYGTNADLKRLFREAARRGLRAILDLVPGHTSIDHPWFKASCSPRPNRYTNWYVWNNNTWDNLRDPRYAGKMVHGYCERNGNFMTNFFWHQPALNFGFGRPDPKRPWQLPVDHPDVKALRREFIRIMRYWLDQGAAGFRVDMAGSLVRNDPGGERIREFWQDVRRMLDRDYPGSFLVSEWSDPKTAIEAGFHADFFHWVSSYEDLFRKESWRSLNGLSDGHSFFDRAGKGDIRRFVDAYLEHYRATRGKGHISIPVGNHDLSRINIRRTQSELEMIFLFLLSMPGVPFIYYGDEIGMRHLDGLPNREGAYRPRSGARTPMQWSRGRNAGFSRAPASRLYLPVDHSPDAPNVQEQERDPASLLNKVRALIGLRRTEVALAADATFTPLFCERGRYPFVYRRSKRDAEMVVALNPSGKPVSATVDVDTDAIEPVWIGGRLQARRQGTSTALDMGPCSHGLFRIQRG